MKKRLFALSILGLMAFYSHTCLASQAQSKSLLSKVTLIPGYIGYGFKSILCCKSLCKKQKTISAYQAIKNITDQYKWQDELDNQVINAQLVESIKALVQKANDPEILRLSQILFPEFEDQNEKLKQYPDRLFELRQAFNLSFATRQRIYQITSYKTHTPREKFACGLANAIETSKSTIAIKYEDKKE